MHGQKVGPVPKLDFAKERATHDALRALIKSRFVKSAHDLSEGGLAVAVAESILAHPNPPPFFAQHVRSPHSVVTVHLIDEEGQPTLAARDEILAFLAMRLQA